MFILLSCQKNEPRKPRRDSWVACYCKSLWIHFPSAKNAKLASLKQLHFLHAKEKQIHSHPKHGKKLQGIVFRMD